jgi:hypothetical protein
MALLRFYNPGGISKNIVTDYAAVGDGVTNDAPSFASFNSAFQSETQQVRLRVPAGDYIFSTNVAQFFCRGIDKVLVYGDGQDVSILNRQAAVSPLFVAGIGQLTGQTQTLYINTVSSGATSLFASTPSHAGRLTAGDYIMVSCGDTQGIFGKDYGFPTNAQRFDIGLRVVSRDTTTGEIVVDRPITNDYISTWPVTYNGSSGGNNQGGPGTIHLLHSSWNTESEWRDLNISQPGAVNDINAYTVGRSVTLRRVTCHAYYSVSPTQSGTVSYIDCTLSGQIEVDKIIERFNVWGGTVNKLYILSSSLKDLDVQDATVTYIAGTPLRTNIDGGTISQLQLGAGGFGYSESTTIGATKATVISQLSPGGLQRSLKGFTVSAGVFRYLKKVAVSGVADNGSGKAQLTVTSTADLETGQILNASGVFNSGGLNIDYQITVVDGTHIDLLGLNFSSGMGTGGGQMAMTVASWGIPGARVMFASRYENEGMFTVTDIYEDATYAYVATDWSGAMPTPISPTTTMNISTHPCPSLNSINASGCREIVDYSQPAARNRPVYEYSKRTYVGATVDATGDRILLTSTADINQKVRMWGEIVSIKINVLTEYTGAGGLSFLLTESNNWPMMRADRSVVNLAATINLRVPGERIITPSGNTGAQSGDTLPTLAAGDRLMGLPNSAPKITANVSANGAGPIFTVEIICDQGF